MQSMAMGMQGMQGMRPMMGIMPGDPAAAGGMIVPGAGGAPMMMGGANPMMGAGPLQQQQNQPVAGPTPANAVQLDPFGAL